MRQALLVDLPLRVLLEEAAVAVRAASSLQAVAVRAASSLQVVAVQAQPVAARRQRDSSAPEHPDSFLQLPAVLVPEAELARVKPTRTRVNRDR